MSDEQRMSEILQHEQDHRQRGIENSFQAHEDVDYLYTRVRLLMNRNKALLDLLDTAYGLVCNSEPDASLDTSHREDWNKVMREFIVQYHAIEKIGEAS